MENASRETSLKIFTESFFPDSTQVPACSPKGYRLNMTNVVQILGKCIGTHGVRSDLSQITELHDAN